MNQSQWTAVDHYLTALFVPTDSALDAAQRASTAAGLPEIQVSAPQGKLLHLIARMRGARRILEIGTLGGYSTIWLARALPPADQGGKLITLELETRHADVARANIDRAGLRQIVEVVVGPALNTLRQLAADAAGRFDLIFIDADKPSYPEYLEWSLRLSRPGTVIIADNIVRKGAVVDEASTDPNVVGVRRFNQLLAADGRVSATAIQTVGCKGYDGFVMAVVN